MNDRLTFGETEAIKENLLLTGQRGCVYVVYDVLARLQRGDRLPTARDVARASGFMSVSAPMGYLMRVGLVEHAEEKRGRSRLLRLVARRKDQ